MRRFWAVAARWNWSFAPFGPRRRNRSSFNIRLRCTNSIFHLLPLPSRGDIGVGCGDGTRHIAGTFMDGTHDLANGRFRATLRLERAGITVYFAGTVTDEAIFVGIVSRHGKVLVKLSEFLAARTGISVFLIIEGEVGPFKSSIPPRRFIEHRDTGLDAFILDQPCKIGCIANIHSHQ